MIVIEMVVDLEAKVVVVGTRTAQILDLDLALEPKAPSTKTR